MKPIEERRWISRDGLTLYARDYPAAGGDARLPVICIHGLTRNSRDFEEVAPWIAALGRRVLAVDVRGRGMSDRDTNPDRYRPQIYARDVLGFMNELGIDKAVFIGTSMGGIITMLVAARRSKAVAAAVLNDVGPEVGPVGISRILEYVGKVRSVDDWDAAAAYVRSTNGAAFPDYRDEDWARFARRAFREVGGKPELDYDPAIMIPLAKGRYKAPKWLAWYLFRRMAKRRPTLVIRGGLSDLLTEEIAARMQREAPAIELVEVPGVGHAPMLTEPEARAGIERFLQRVD